MKKIKKRTKRRNTIARFVDGRSDRSIKTDELYDIIRDRVEYAFRPDSLKNVLIKLASVAAQGDARTGLEIVRKAGKKAEVRHLNEVTLRELEETTNETNKLKMVYPIDKLDEHQKVIYEILEKKENYPLDCSIMNVAL